MFDFNDPSLTVQMCKFQAFIQKSHIIIKFPCSYFVQWKTINNRYSICTQKRVRTANDQAIFNQKLTFYTQMVYHNKRKQYYSKQTFLVLNLVSKSRPDQVKLVGRVSVDLADVLNKGRYAEMAQMKLNYCSVEGSVMFSIHLINKRDSNLSVRDLDRSAFTDYFSINNANNNIPPQTITITNKTKSNSLTKVPSFAQVNNNILQQHHLVYNNHHNSEQQLMSFQNSYEKPSHQDKKQTIRTQSREQSLIQRLQERNLGDIWERQRENGNIVDVGRREIRTGRDNVNCSQEEIVVSKRTHVRSKSRTLATTNGNNGDIVQTTHKINTTIVHTASQKAPYQSDTSIINPQPKPTPLQKPTSPPSYELTHNNNNNNNKKTIQQQKQPMSEQYSYQTQKFLSIVEKLQRQKQQQEGMIRQLKAMVVSKSMRKMKMKNQQKQKKKVPIVAVVQPHSLQQQLQQLHKQHKQLQLTHQQITTKLNQISEQNGHLNQQLMKLKSLLLQKDNRVEQSERTINELRRRLMLVQDKQRKYEQELRVKKKEYDWVQTQRLRLSQQCIQLQQQCKSMTQPLPPSQPNNYTPQVIVPKHQQQLQQQQQIRITITKDENIYQDMQKENTQLIQRVKQLQEQNAIYQQLLRQKQKMGDGNGNGDGNVNGNKDNVNSHQQVVGVSDNNINSNNTGSALLHNMLSNLHEQQLQSQSQPQPATTTTVAPSNSEFKITITRDDNIYQQQQQQNKQLYKRVIQLEDQVEKYRQLINQQNNLSQPIIYNSNNQQQQQQDIIIRRQQRRLTNKSSLQKQEKYQQQGFTIRLTKDNNIFENQQQQLQQLNKQIDDLQGRLKQQQHQISKYVSAYGNINDQHEYRVSITRQENIYDDQQREIKQLWVTVDNKDHEIQSLTQRISMLEHQLQQITSSDNYKNEGQIMIRINREENIYEQQENQLNQLSKKVIALEEIVQNKEKEVQLKEKVIVEKDCCIKELQLEALVLNAKLEEYHDKAMNSLQQITPTKSQNCLSCPQLSSQLHQLQQTNYLLQQQKVILQQQISKLQQQKFCFNSTQNELKIQIEELNEEVYQLELENEKLNEELMIIQQSEDERRQGEGNVMSTGDNNNNITLMQQQNAQLRQSLTLFEQQLQQQQLTIGQLQQRISLLMHEKQILIEQNTQLNNQLKIVRQNQQKSKPPSPLPSQPTAHNIQSLLSNNRIQQGLLLKKQQQIQHLQAQLNSLNQSLNELSLSYHNMQQTFQSLQKQKQTQMRQLQLQKQSEVEHIRNEHEQINAMLKNQLQQIQLLITEKQKLCAVNQEKLQNKASLIQQLSSQLDQLTNQLNTLEVENHRVVGENERLKVRLLEQTGMLNKQVNALRSEVDRLTVENDKLSGENCQMQQTPLQLSATRTMTPPPINSEKLSQLKQAINTIQCNRQLRQLQLNSLQQILQSSNKQQQSATLNQALPKLITRQLQKIKTNILRNHTSQNYTIEKRSVVTQRNVVNIDRKAFAQKAALLKYLKPLQDMLKDY